MKKFVCASLSIVCCLCHLAHGQESLQNYFQSDKIEINYHKTECHDVSNDIHKRIIAFEFVNLTGDKLSVNFNKELWYNDNCIGCDSTPEQQFTVQLEPGQRLAGSCEDKRNKSLYIVDGMLHVNSSVLTRFELKDISIQNA